MSTSKHRVVITGDSILRLGESGLPVADVLFDCEDGRNVLTKGTSGRLSSTEAARLYLPMVAPGGYFVFQDNGLGCTTAQWDALMIELRDTCPADVTLVGVMPVCVAPLQQYAAEVAAKNGAMVNRFNDRPAGTYDFVRWSQKVDSDPAVYVYDGQHPTAAGSAWLNSEIGLVTT